MEDTFDKVKDKAKEVAKKVTDKDTYLGDEEKKNYESEGRRADKEPMSPENIREHEPTAVKRDQDQGIVEEGQSDTDNPEAREQYKKKGMTKV